MNSPLLTIVGETASGKSKLALDLARSLNGEIICADSWTVRRHVNIGTDKPSVVEMELVPHHLVDIIEPDEDFTAAVYKGLAEEAIDDIARRGKLPILVGGSGLYIDSVLFNYGFLEAGDRQDRQLLNDMTIKELLGVLSSSQVSVAGIDQRNKRRLIRLIETGGQRPTKQLLRPNTIVIGLSRSIDELKQLIETRVDRMVSDGLEGEVRQLVKKYGRDCEALKGVGYRQWMAYFDGHQTLTETRQQIISATLNLAKKQRTWFRRNKSIHWLKQPINEQEIVDLVTTEFADYHFL